jgi:hypothetical protein
MIEQLPDVTASAYGLCDAWYTCEKVINAYFKKGYHLIGALKTNRVIFPQGIRIQIKDFAQYIERNDVCPVTVNNVTYLVYRYEGSLNGVYCTVGITGRYQRFNTGLKQVRKSVQREMYAWIYHASENEIPIEDVFCRMKVS